MADIFRIEKTKNFTVMSNHHLQNPRLTLKAQGLLSKMLSLPDNWDYSLAGLVKICMEGKDAINKALGELEAEGYLTRHQVRGTKGRFSRTEFIIREIPIPPCTENPSTVEMQTTSALSQASSPCTENRVTVEASADLPCTDYPYTVNPSTDNPCPENPPQSSTKGTKELKEQNTYPSIYQEESAEEIVEEDKIEEILQDQIEYDVLVQDPDYFGGSSGPELLDSIVEILKAPFTSSKTTCRISGENIATEAVRSRLRKLECEHIKYVYDCVFGSQIHPQIKNMKAYLLTALYNAPITYAAYCTDQCRNA